MDSTSIGSSGDGQGKVPMTFAEADQMYVSLKRLHETGALTADAFDAQLKQMMVQDADGRWWSKSRDSGEWFYYDGKDWLRGTPPAEPAADSTIITSTVTPTTDGGSASLAPEPEDVEEDPVPPVDFRKDEVTPEPIVFPNPIPTPVLSPVTAPLADSGPRTLAWLIDVVLVSIVSFVLGAIGASSLGFIVGIGYYVYFWSTTGQTLGMRSQNIRVVRTDGQPLTWETGAVRYVGYVIGALCILIGLLWLYWDPKRQAWHDKMAHTLVVRAPQ